MTNALHLVSSMLLTLVLSIYTAAGQSDGIVVIVNPVAAPLSKEQVADLYLGRSSGWIPIDQSSDSEIYAEFYKKATGRDSAQVKAIWSRIQFTGRGLPPRQLPDSAAMKKAVAANPKAVGYIQRSALDASVKAVLLLD